MLTRAEWCGNKLITDIIFRLLSGNIKTRFIITASYDLKIFIFFYLNAEYFKLAKILKNYKKKKRKKENFYRRLKDNDFNRGC